MHHIIIISRESPYKYGINRKLCHHTNYGFGCVQWNEISIYTCIRYWRLEQNPSTFLPTKCSQIGCEQNASIIIYVKSLIFMVFVLFFYAFARRVCCAPEFMLGFWTVFTNRSKSLLSLMYSLWFLEFRRFRFVCLVYAFSIIAKTIAIFPQL